MRKKIFIHIGTHKTGTTSIQFFLQEHRGKLKSAGILVPRAGTGIIDAPAGHHNIAYELCGDPNFDRNLGRTAELIAELRGAPEPIAVISSENLQFLHGQPDKLHKFDQDLDAAGYDRTYLVYFRNPEDYFKSMYTQLKNTERLPSGTYASLYKRMQTDGHFLDRISRNFEFDYARFRIKWQSIVGPHLTHFDFDDIVKSIGLLPSFLEAIGASPEIVHQGSGFPRFNVTKVGRNDPCPCQSGKRYKNCHGQNA